MAAGRDEKARPRLGTLAGLWAGFALLISAAALFLAGPPPAPERVRFEPPALPLEAGFPKWSRVMARTWAQSGGEDTLCSERLGRDCHLRSWRRFLEGLRDRPVFERIIAVNRFVNAVRYRPDGDNWGVGDYWAAPGEFFASGGDCEDYAIAKYYSLRRLGFPAERLRIVVLHDKRRKLPHAVLAVRWSGSELVLDNLGDEPRLWQDVRHYQPIYAVNEAHYELLGLPPARTRHS